MNHLMKTCLLNIFTRILFVGSLLLGFMHTANAEIDHSSHMSASTTKPPSCTGSGLDCANAATPFFGPEGNLYLAWTAGGEVSVAQSVDLGKTFTQAVVVAGHGKSLDTGADARPQITVDSDNKIFLAYAFFKDSNWNAQINTVSSVDGGKSFTTPKSLVNDGSSQRFPSVVIQPDNSIFIAWIDKRLVADAKKVGQERLGGSIAYAFSNDGGNTFSSERFANENSCECCRIGATSDPQGGVGIVYRAIFPGGVRDHATQIIHASDEGVIRRISKDEWKTDACPHHGPSIAISSSGKIHVAWFTQGSARSGVFYASSNNQGKTYSRPQRIGQEDENISRPYLLAQGKSVYLVWKRFDGNRTSIFLKQSSDDGKTWTPPAIIASTDGYSDHPLLISKNQQVYLSWLTREDGYQLIPLKLMQ
jgi:hypothetical protein